jgi:hypothetical protein
VRDAQRGAEEVLSEVRIWAGVDTRDDSHERAISLRARVDVWSVPCSLCLHHTCTRRTKSRRLLGSTMLAPVREMIRSMRPALGSILPWLRGLASMHHGRAGAGRSLYDNNDRRAHKNDGNS